MRNKGFCDRYLAVVLFLVIAIFSAPESTAADSRMKNILILNSYHHGLSWTDQEVDGILSVLKQADERFNISIEYMDWKSFASQNNLDQLKERYRFKYSNMDIDMIITTDDAALEFALKNRETLFSDAPVVFCGVNDEGADNLTKGMAGVTGVIEEVDPVKTVKAALKINPDINRVYLVYDQTESGRSTGQLSVNGIYRISPVIEVVELNDGNMDNILETVSQAPENSIVLSTTYSEVSDGSVNEFEYYIRKLSQYSKVPVYSLYDFAIGYGVVGGSMLSGKSQGQKAAQMAIKILNGVDIKEIPFDHEDTARYIFDYKELQRFRISIDSIPEDSEIINKPFNFFEEYKAAVITVLIIVTLLLAFIMVLIFNLRRINAMKEKLNDNHVELTGLYENLTIADNKLKQQINELVAVQEDLISSEGRYELLFDKMINGCFVFEPILNAENKITEIRFIKVNPGFYHQAGLPVKDVAGKTWSEVFGFPNREISIFQNLLTTGNAERFETCHPENEKYYVVDAFLIAKNKIGVIFDNITDYKSAIKSIKLLNEELERRVTERTSELQAALNELESFSYTVSHDLKSPLRAVDGYTQILLDDLETEIDSDAKEMLQNIRTISREAIEMINKLLQYSKTSRAVLDKEMVDIRKKVSDVFSELLLTNHDRDISLVIDTELPDIYVDRVLFRLLLQNVLSNAIRFTKNREKAIIHVGCTSSQNEYVFYIKDNGAGFDMTYSHKLFSIFQRLHTNDEFEGNGIGLVTVKKIIEKHGGRVWIEGKPDAGAVIYFTIPLNNGQNES